MSSIPKLVTILGVHRSGTSLLTSGLEAAGICSGNFVDIHDDDNPYGYREHPEIRRFNERLLRHLGVSWDNWGFRGSIVDFDAEEFAVWRSEAEALLQASFEGVGPFVLKDPRISTLLPFWNRVIPEAGFATRFILILRDPVEVARSQMQRVARRAHQAVAVSDPESMAALWTVTISTILNTLEKDRVVLVVRHDLLLRDPVGTLAAAASFAGVSNPSGAIERFARERVKLGLYRARAADVRAAEGIWLKIARRLYKALATGEVPYLLSNHAAQDILSDQEDMSRLVQGLEPVRHSISNLTTKTPDIERMSRFVWSIGRIVSMASKEELDAVAAMIDDAVIKPGANGLPLSMVFVVNSILTLTGRFEDAECWLRSAKNHFGGHEMLLKAEAQLRQRREAPRVSREDP